uniref:Uncharacterized protein LOC102809907 n=1 Tax=Saccoglossus kowalevskii TaxID=10224 RepID=A0ABM0M5H2_SACKO|nr:PREDICTED: uncharacterized protein LOC102809907 [Saccoglossus kowalevskii]
MIDYQIKEVIAATSGLSDGDVAIVCTICAVVGIIIVTIITGVICIKIRRSSRSSNDTDDNYQDIDLSVQEEEIKQNEYAELQPREPEAQYASLAEVYLYSNESI